jgi:hypothetical protein
MGGPRKACWPAPRHTLVMTHRDQDSLPRAVPAQLVRAYAAAQDPPCWVAHLWRSFSSLAAGVLPSMTKIGRQPWRSQWMV